MIKFYFCKTCGNIIEKVEDSGMTPSCCNKLMTELKSASTDGATEKHVPVVTISNLCEGINKVVVEVGSTHHPMEDMHHIMFITLETSCGSYRKTLTIGDKPCAEFLIPEGEDIIAAYSYCNLHGLWVYEATI